MNLRCASDPGDNFRGSGLRSVTLHVEFISGPDGRYTIQLVAVPQAVTTRAVSIPAESTRGSMYSLFDGPLPLIGSREPYVPC